LVEGAVRAMKDGTLQASPEKIKKQQEDAHRSMKELLLPPAHRRKGRLRRASRQRMLPP